MVRLYKLQKEHANQKGQNKEKATKKLKLSKLTSNPAM
jgi:hypothetical protein